MLKHIKFIKFSIMAFVLGLVFGLLIFYFQPVSWKSTALVGLGGVHNLGGTGTPYVAVEPLSLTLERLKTPTFLTLASRNTKNKSAIKLLLTEKCGCIGVKTLKGDSALVLTVNADTQDVSQDSLDAIVKELRIQHDSLLDKFKSDVKQRVNTIVSDRVAESKLVDLLNKNLERSMATGGAAGNGSLLFLALQTDLAIKQINGDLARDMLNDVEVRPSQLLVPISNKFTKFFDLWQAVLLGLLISALFFTFIGFRKQS